ncbi:MAG: SCO family protein [Siculibacillus sp.]|nr:SCO family protein [Siculibacillus sp.]
MSLGSLRVVLWVLIIAIAGGLGSYVLLREQTPQRVENGLLKPVAGIGGPFALLDQKRRPFTERELEGMPTAMFFGYTFCPDVCPTTLLEATAWMTELGADGDKLRVVFVSVDPERDTPEKLDAYLASFDSRFIGLSGSREETDRIVKAYRVFARKVEGKGGDYTMDHTAAIYLLDAKGRFVGVINFQEQTDKALAKIRQLLGKA